MALVKTSDLAAYAIDDAVHSAEEAAANGLIHVETTKDGVHLFGTYDVPEESPEPSKGK